MATTIQWRIGCSGFHYKEWKGVFYPEKLAAAKWFDYYCGHFNTLELNVTFYRFPQLKTLQGWYDKSPDDFLFAVKAPRLITHYKKFTGTEALLDDFYGSIGEGLKEKLGVVLFQLPPQTVYSEETLRRVMAGMNNSFANAIEFRHSSWWQPDVYRQLARRNISFCGISHPRLPQDVVINTGRVYYRFHGVPDMYKSPYTYEQLEAVAEPIIADREVKAAHIYFNNTAGPAAINNARWLSARVR